MLRTPLIRPEAAAMKGADRPEADYLFLVIVVPFVLISWLQFTGRGKLDENRRQARLQDYFHPVFHIGWTPDASCTAEPGKKMPPLNSNIS